MNQLCFTHLLRKTSVIGSIKVKGQGPVAGAWRSGPLCATCFSTFFRLELFSPELEVSDKKILKRNPANKKRAGGSGSTTHINFQQIDG
jgi:hypothetical protein